MRSIRSRRRCSYSTPRTSSSSRDSHKSSMTACPARRSSSTSPQRRARTATVSRSVWVCVTHASSTGSRATSARGIDDMSAHHTPSPTASREPNRRVHPSELLRARKLWIAPLLIASAFIALISVIYIGSVVNPIGHLHGLPVMLVNEDQGAVVHGQRVDVGASLAGGLEGSAAPNSRLDLHSVTLVEGHKAADRGRPYATVI